MMEIKKLKIPGDIPLSLRIFFEYLYFGIKVKKEPADKIVFKIFSTKKEAIKRQIKVPGHTLKKHTRYLLFLRPGFSK